MASGDYPIWGTCLGFELLALVSNKDRPNLKLCHANDEATNLHIATSSSAWRTSKIGQDMPKDVLQILTSTPSAIQEF